MTGRYMKRPYRPNPDAPYQVGDVIRMELGTDPPQWEVLCVGRDTYYLKSLSRPSYHHPREEAWVKWSCESATVLVSRAS